MTKFIYMDEHIYEGDYNNGIKEGLCKITYHDYTYEGGYKND